MNACHTDKSTRISNHIFPYFFIIVTGIICYSGTFDSPFIFDDMPSIVENLSIQNLSDLKSIWKFSETRFMVYLSFALNFYFHGLKVFGYHFVNLTIHLLAALTVFWLIRLIFLTPELKKNQLAKQVTPIALTVSLLFVSHPIQTQAVTYIVQRAASMTALFYLLSVALYIKARLHQTKAKKGHILFYSLSITAALIAMFTKEIALSLPLCIILCEYCFFSPSLNQMTRRLSYLWPMLLTFPVIPVTTLLTKTKLIAHLGLAMETDTISRQDYLLTQFNVIRTYLRLLFFPINQSVDYDYPLAHHLLEPRTIASFLLLIAILVAALILFKKFRVIAFGVLWFYLTLAVESSLIPIRDVIFEHRLYLPCFGIFLSSTALLFYLLDQRMKILKILLTIFICLTSLATINRNVIWKNSFFIWHDAVAKKNISVRTLNNLGVGYINLGRLGMALLHYDKAIKLFPKHAKLHFNRGMAEQISGNTVGAVEAYTESIRLYPKYHRTFFYRGIAHIELSQYDEALKDLDKAIEIHAGDSDIFYNRSCLYLVLGKHESAIKDANRAIELDKDKPFYYRHRSLVLYRLNRYDKALMDINRAIQTESNYGNNYLLRGKIYQKMGETVLADKDFKEARELATGRATSLKQVID